MHARLCCAVALAVFIASPAQAAGQLHFDPSDTSVILGSMVVVAPFYVSYRGVEGSGEVVGAGIDTSQRWKVGAVRPEGDKTALELHSDDRLLKIDMAIDTRIAQEQKIQVGDGIAIDAIGKAGYAVKKGEATIALLAEPGSGMAHSQPRT